MHKVIIFPAGTEIGLEIFDSLRDEKNLEIYGGTSSMDFSSIIYPKKRLKKLPYVSNKKFADELVKICKKEQIKTVFPAHDEVIKILAENREKFKKNKIDLIIHPGQTSITCRSKFLTYKALKGCKFIPNYSLSLTPEFAGPYFLKPIVGQGSKGCLKAKNISEIQILSEQYNLNNYIICELLTGNEYTVDCFTDFKGDLVFCQGRVREHTTNGISVSTSRIENPKFKRIAKAIQKRIPMNGAWFFQVKENSIGELKLLEVGARIAGSSSYARFCGVNLSLMNLYNLQKMPVKILPIEPRVSIKKRIKPFASFEFEFDYVYIDLDDTIIVNNSINLNIVKFIYWCLNNNKKLILVTRHNFNVLETLSKFRIQNLFDEIIHVIDGSSKCLSIKSKKSIFIDDSFRERLSVSKKHGIPTYSTQCLPEIY